jgi:hypothetical protein
VGHASSSGNEKGLPPFGVQAFISIASRSRGPRNLVAKAQFKPWRDFASRSRGPRNLVAKGGIEPPTHGFSVRCSTN